MCARRRARYVHHVCFGVVLADLWGSLACAAGSWDSPTGRQAWRRCDCCARVCVCVCAKRVRSPAVPQRERREKYQHARTRTIAGCRHLPVDGRIGRARTVHSGTCRTPSMHSRPGHIATTSARMHLHQLRRASNLSASRRIGFIDNWRASGSRVLLGRLLTCIPELRSGSGIVPSRQRIHGGSRLKANEGQHFFDID